MLSSRVVTASDGRFVATLTVTVTVSALVPPAVLANRAITVVRVEVGASLSVCVAAGVLRERQPHRPRGARTTPVTDSIMPAPDNTDVAGVHALHKTELAGPRR